jgi:hypothetical protein
MMMDPLGRRPAHRRCLGAVSGDPAQLRGDVVDRGDAAHAARLAALVQMLLEARGRHGKHEPGGIGADVALPLR